MDAVQITGRLLELSEYDKLALGFANQYIKAKTQEEKETILMMASGDDLAIVECLLLRAALNYKE